MTNIANISLQIYLILKNNFKISPKCFTINQNNNNGKTAFLNLNFTVYSVK